MGGALLWVRFDELGLPADRAVSLLPREMLVTVGGHALIVPAIAGLGAVIAIYALEAEAQLVLDLFAFLLALAGALIVENALLDLSIGTELIFPSLVAVAVAAAFTWGVHKLSKRRLKKERSLTVTFVVLAVAAVALVGLALKLPVLPDMLIVALVTLAGAAAIFATATRDELGHRPVLWVVFLSFLLVGAAVALARTADEPKMEPVAVLLTSPDEEIAGFYVGEADGRIHIAQLRHPGGLLDVSADPVESIVSVSRDRVTRMALRAPAGLGLADAGREEAETLLEDLIAERRAASGEAPPPADPFETDNPARTFAPLASIHSGEPSAPTSTDYFLKGSSLRWSFRGCASKRIDGKLTTKEQWRKLGEGGYTQPAHCGDKGETYSSRNYTRPYGNGRRGLVGREGFYLDLDNKLRKPEVKSTPQGSQRVLDSVPVYYETHSDPNPDKPSADQRITYWFFYPFSIPPGGNDKISHEGDWERLSVLVHKEKDGRWTPLTVRYHEHDSFVDVPWADVRKAPDETGLATHPRAYVAKGSHATYRRAGKFVQVLAPGRLQILKVVDDARACPDCPLWFTWRTLVNAELEPWYGFGGAWGQVASVSDFTGPLGPSIFKTLGKSDSPETTLQQASEGVGPVPAPAEPVAPNAP